MHKNIPKALQMSILRMRIYRFFCLSILYGKQKRTYEQIAQDFQDCYGLTDDDICFYVIRQNFVRMRDAIRTDKNQIKNLLKNDRITERMGETTIKKEK